MDCGICVLPLLKKDELVKFIQKIGHYQAARIIEEHNIDGSKILELKAEDIFSWHLSDVEEELLWKCIYQLKLNHLTESDSQYVQKRKQKPPDTPPKPIPSMKYFRYRPIQKQNSDVTDYISTKNSDKRDLLLSNALGSASLETKKEINSEYVVSSSEKSNTLVSRKKKCVSFPFKKKDRYEELRNSGCSYIELIDIATTKDDTVNSKKKSKPHIYEEAPVLTSKKKSKMFKFNVKLFCLSCSVNYNTDS